MAATQEGFFLDGGKASQRRPSGSMTAAGFIGNMNSIPKWSERSRSGDGEAPSMFRLLLFQLQQEHENSLAALQAEVHHLKRQSGYSHKSSEQHGIQEFNAWRMRERTRTIRMSEETGVPLAKQVDAAPSDVVPLERRPQDSVNEMPSITHSPSQEQVKNVRSGTDFMWPINHMDSNASRSWTLRGDKRSRMASFQVRGNHRPSQSSSNNSVLGDQSAYHLWPEWCQESKDLLGRRALAARFGNAYRLGQIDATSSRRFSTCSEGDASARLEDQAETGFRSERSDRCCVLPRNCCVILSPSGRWRIAWDMMGLVMLGYDIVLIPLQVFEPPETWLSVALGWATLAYWTADMYLSFTTGYYQRDGSLCMRPAPIVKRYIKTWFALDFMIIGVDWFLVALDFLRMREGEAAGSVGLARLGKIMRIARIVRSLRLLRLMKLRQIVHVLQASIDSEWFSIIVGMVQNVLTLMGINHIIACVWFLLGSNSGPPSWVEKYVSKKDGYDYVEQYLVSFHWSLTQFTPATMHVQPMNVDERAFAVVVLLFAMVTFSSFISSITSAMTRLRNLKTAHLTQVFLLRKFLNENRVSRDLSARVTRYIDLVLEIHKTRTDMDKVELLQLLSGPLRLELQKEIHEPHLSVHAYFKQYSKLSPTAMAQLCYTAVSKLALSKGDMLFHVGDECRQMFFLMSGTVFYRRAKGVKGYRKSSSADSSFKLIPARRLVRLGEKQWFSEAVLWVRWIHRGTMKALIESDLVSVHGGKFREVTISHADVVDAARQYAVKFFDELKGLSDENGTAWDVPTALMYHMETEFQTLGQEGQSHKDEIVCAEAIEVAFQDDSESESSENENELWSPSHLATPEERSEASEQ